MEEQIEIKSPNKNSSLFFGIVAVATLVIAIIGGTFAYFTATQTAGSNIIKGNAASISFGLTVTKVTNADTEHGGLIPLTNGMATPAVANKCVDNNNNAVCQIYKITISNTGTAGIFLDGYVDLSGGAPGASSQSPTNMRWVEVFATGSGTSITYSVSGTPALAPGATNISQLNLASSGTSGVNLDSTETTGTYTFNGNSYTYINKNYMRTSDKTSTTSGYNRGTTAQALVINQYLAPASDTTNSKRDLYFALWLSETGTDQTMSGNKNNGFFSGTVTFNSAQGGEVSAVFDGYTRTAKKTS